MAEIIRQQWRDQTAAIKYPFADGATLENNEGDEIPSEIFVDAIFHPIGNAAALFLSRIYIDPPGVLFEFSGSSGPVCTAFFSRNSPPKTLVLKDTHNRPAGRIICQQVALAAVASWASGDHIFSRAATLMAPTTVMPMPETGVRGFLVGEEVFAGHVKLVAEDGIRFRIDDNEIRVDAVGDPLFLRKSCEREEQTGQSSLKVGPFLKTINGKAPDAAGNLIIAVGNELVDDPVVRVQPRPFGLAIRLVGTKS